MAIRARVHRTCLFPDLLRSRGDRRQAPPRSATDGRRRRRFHPGACGGAACPACGANRRGLLRWKRPVVQDPAGGFVSAAADRHAFPGRAAGRREGHRHQTAPAARPPATAGRERRPRNAGVEASGWRPVPVAEPGDRCPLSRIHSAATGRNRGASGAEPGADGDALTLAFRCMIIPLAAV